MAARSLLFLESWLQYLRGDLDEPMRQMRKLVAWNRQQGDLQALDVASNALGRMLMDAGQWEEAETALSEAAEASDRLGLWIDSRFGLAELHARKNQPGEARQVLEVARQRAGGRAGDLEAIILMWMETLVLAAEGCHAEALASFEQVADALHQKGQRWLGARCLVDWADVCLLRNEAGDRSHATELLCQAQAAYADMKAARYAQAVHEKLRALGGV
jgi:tetratricopeptide (TPR) repeat protein